MGGANLKDLLRTVRKTFGRFVAILAIIALGTGFLAGLRCTQSAMMATAQKYIDTQALFDFRVMNTYGFTREDADRLRSIPGIRAAEGAVSLDVLATREDREGELALRLLSMMRDVSKPDLQKGRMPEKAGECLADSNVFSERDIGKSFIISESNKQSTLDSITTRKITIVGLCTSPLFMNFERGSSSVGDGSLSAFLYVPQTTFDMDGVFTEIQLKLDKNYTIYSQEYKDALERMTDILEPVADELAGERFITVRDDAQWELEDAKRQYDDGLRTYKQEKANAERELAEAKEKIDDAKAELDENQAKLDEGFKALETAQAQLDYGMAQLLAGEKLLQEQKAAAYEKFAESEALLSQQMSGALMGQRQLQSALAQLDSGLKQIDDGLQQIEDGLAQLDRGIAIAEAGLATTRNLLEMVENSLDNPIFGGLMEDYKASLERQIADGEKQLAELQAQREEVLAQQAPLLEKREGLQTQRDELADKLDEVNDGIRQIEDGKAELESARRQAEDSFAAAAAQAELGKLELEQGQKELDENRALLDESQAKLDEGWAQWQAGKDEYDAAEAEAREKLDSAKAELDDAKAKIEDGEQALADMAEPTAYVLDRTTNVAYVCFESDAGIVAGVSKIFPLFFFAVAALVCLTTMTKMVDEERTQIGVKKALGYGPLAIGSKYMLYSGAASLLGCIIGVAAGSVVFPKVIWMGYQIMYDFTPEITLSVDVPLCCIIVASFTLLMLAVTWASCGREMRDVPAELIRPKAPKAGKRLIMERLFFWKYLSFLQKVSIRNIFRYRKRLVMMLLGVGGCTALVVTGLGLGDTIVGIADTQFTQVTVYDMAVNFTGHQDAEAIERFEDALTGTVDSVRFGHFSTVDMSFGSGTKSLNLLAATDLDGFFDLHRGSRAVAFPKEGEAIINNGLSRSMGISVGDTITVRNADMEQAELRVSGIFDNSVFNYVICTPETLAKAWGHEAEVNYALINAPDYMEVHSVSQSVSRQKGVANVTVSQDMMTRVANMLESMNYIVGLVIACAAALAFIVMYNLTNINISERVREIATIKVLGFYSRESAAYVFREGLALTLMGSAVGLAAGKYLHAFVMDKIRIDMVYFAPRVDTFSYILAFVLTILFALAVDFALYFKLEKINMAEALKSVE